MNEQGLSSEQPEQEPTEPTPEVIGKTLKTIFIEAAATATEEDAKSFKNKLAESPEWQFVPRGESESQVAERDGEKVLYDLQKDLGEILGQLANTYVVDLESGQREMTEIIEEAMSIVESLGGDSGVVIEKLTEIGILE